MDKGNGVVSAEVKVTAHDEDIIDNQISTQSSGATVVPNAHPGPESNSYLGGKKQAMASEPDPNKTYKFSNKSLLASGVFDAAPVKYTLRSRDIILHGVIKGLKILCSCNGCNNSKYISPSKFERHAGGKTKRPYSYIYFENGKTIDQVCRELRATPKDMFFHRLPEIAGSAFGWLTFNNWKGHSDLDSSLAAAPSIKMEHF